MSDPAERPFEAVLFDFGGVFIDSPFPAFAASSVELGLDAARLIELTFGPLDEDTDHPWHRVERGELPILDAREEIIALCQAEDLEVDPFRLLAGTMGAQTRARAPVVECVHAIRGVGLKTGLLTNNAFEIRERWRAVLPLAELFDDVVDSSEVGVRKPDRVIYELALERLGGVDPGAAIFLDDLPSNVEAAEALGMRGILVESDPASALAQLRSLVLSAAG
jgi:epoxide hydrolase-like predicted phosphatase